MQKQKQGHQRLDGAAKGQGDNSKWLSLIRQYAEVISYNKKNLERKLQNENRQHNRQQGRTKGREEEI